MDSVVNLNSPDSRPAGEAPVKINARDSITKLDLDKVENRVRSGEVLIKSDARGAAEQRLQEYIDTRETVV